MEDIMDKVKIAKRVAKSILSGSPRLKWNMNAGSNDPWQLARDVGINILSNKNFVCGHVVDGEFVSSLFDYADQDEYEFDIVVHPKWQRKGLGSKLLDVAISEFDNYADVYGDDFVFNVDAVNKHMVTMLKRKGFYVTDSSGGHTMMTRG
jgi:ribosomal protein S18 acetylase RimI-like enzyme